MTCEEETLRVPVRIALICIEGLRLLHSDVDDTAVQYGGVRIALICIEGLRLDDGARELQGEDEVRIALICIEGLRLCRKTCFQSAHRLVRIALY